MKLFITLLCIINWLCTNIYAQEHIALADNYSDAIEAYQREDYKNAYQFIQKAEQNEGNWDANISYWKIKILDKTQNYQDINHPQFIELNKEISLLFTDAEKVAPEDRKLYDDYYEHILTISDKVDARVLHLRWNNDKDYTEAKMEFDRNNYGLAKLKAELAIKSNNGLAYQLIGQLYENGWGVTKDYSLAYENYAKAFIAGNIDAAYHIGYCTFYGYGVSKNINQAFEWCMLAAEHNYTPAMKEISNMYKKGIGTPRNIAESDKWKKWSKQ